MSTPKSSSAAQKKKRLVQLRDAQRRRRERLREDKQYFVQIILPEYTLAQLSQMIALSGETMQQAIARLVQSSLPSEDVATIPKVFAPEVTSLVVEEIEEIQVPVSEPLPIPEIVEDITEPQTTSPDIIIEEIEITTEVEEEFTPESIADEFIIETILEETPEPDFSPPPATTKKVGQLDLFG